jgi:hypothetical protein
MTFTGHRSGERTAVQIVDNRTLDFTALPLEPRRECVKTKVEGWEYEKTWASSCQLGKDLERTNSIVTSKGDVHDEADVRVNEHLLFGIRVRRYSLENFSVSTSGFQQGLAVSGS